MTTVPKTYMWLKAELSYIFKIIIIIFYLWLRLKVKLCKVSVLNPELKAKLRG